MATQDTTNKKVLLLREAEDAARRGDPAGMVRGLFASGALDDAVWRLGQDFYGKLGPDDVRDCVAEGVASCYTALATGKRVTTVVGYILKAARNYAIDLAATIDEHVYGDPDSICDGRDHEQDAAGEEVRLVLRREALQRARDLLPQLGQENLQNVMEVIFDAVEKEVVDLTDDEIGEITGLQPDTVRRLKNRGFERLRRLAAENGYHLAAYERAVRPSVTVPGPDETFNKRSFDNE